MLSCEQKNTTSALGGTDAAAASTTPCYNAEIMYQRAEHVHKSSPSERFRHPQEIQTKNFVIRHELKRCVGRGDKIPLLCLPRNARSACPKEVMEDILYNNNQKISLDFLVFGLLAVLLLFVGAARAVLRLDESLTGCKVLLLGMLIVEGLPWIYCTDQFLKMKRMRFDNGRPVKLTKSGKRS